MAQNNSRTNNQHPNRQSRGCLSYILVIIATIVLTLVALYFGARMLISQNTSTPQNTPPETIEVSGESSFQIVLGEAQINELLMTLISDMGENPYNLNLWAEEGQIHGTAEVNYQGNLVPVSFSSDLVVSDNQTFMIQFTSLQLSSLPLPMSLAYPVLTEQVQLPEGLTFVSDDYAIEMDINDLLNLDSEVQLVAQSADLANNEVVIDVVYNGMLIDIFE